MSEIEHYMKATSRLRGALTMAEDALRAIAAPDCMIEHDDDGSWIDTGAPARIAHGALKRIEQALEASEERP